MAGLLPNTSCQMLILSPTVLSRVPIFMVIYEVASAVLPLTRTMQALNRAGP